MKEITINDRGIFITETRQLKTLSILQLRRKLEHKILRARRRIQDLELQRQETERELVNFEEQLRNLRGPLVEGYIEKERKAQEEANLKAQTLLRELIGEQLFQELQLRSKIIFEAKDHMIYKIESNGRVYRKVEKEWQQLCIVRPKDLPLPDFLLSLFVSIRQNPSSYRLRRR